MQSDIFKATNEGKGIIFLPHDKEEHPIVGACLSPLDPALDCIELPNSTLPDWVAAARTSVGYDDTLDKTSPPKITMNTTTYELHPYEVEAFGGYSLMVNDSICPMHYTQGIFRNKGKAVTRRNRSVTVYDLPISDSTGTLSSSSTSYVFPSIGTKTEIPDTDTCEYALMPAYSDAMALRYTEAVPVKSSLPTVYLGGHMEYLYIHYTYNCYISGGRTYKQNYFNYLPTRGCVFNIQTNNERYHQITHSYFVKFNEAEETYDTVTPTVETGEYKMRGDKGIILYANKDNVTSGVDYGTSLDSTVCRGVQTIDSDLTRDTTKGFMTGTPKGLVVRNELRRDFLRISPTVFSHTRGF